MHRVPSILHSHALNTRNNLYFQHPEAFDPSSGLASLFVVNPVINNALGVYIARHVRKKTVIKIKELASGKRSIDKWQYIKTMIPQSSLHVLLSDTVPLNVVSCKKEKGILFNYELYSLLQPLPHLFKNKRFDIILITYGFDSVWLPEDVTYVKRGGRLYQEGYDLCVDTNAKNYKQLACAIQNKKLTQDVSLKD